MTDLLTALQSAERGSREPYQPGSGLEGAAFMARFCDRCERDEAFRNGTGDSCPIAANTMVFNEDEPEYPVEWRQDGPKGPRCTAFVALVRAKEAM